MENKINIVELLRDCPKGMELDCTVFEDVYFDNISDCGRFIYCYINHEDHKTSICFNKYGAYSNLDKSKCVIFPKGKTTWEGFNIPFKNGDVCTTIMGTIFIYQKTTVSKYCGSYISLNERNELHPHYNSFPEDCCRFATEEEKQKLFDAIKANGYKWNPETKTLEKLPKFKVGDKIKDTRNNSEGIILKVTDEGYECHFEFGNFLVTFSEQDYFNLVPHKFDIRTLKPFESKVLVRNVNGDLWKPAEYGFSYSKGHYVVGGIYWKQCIPYKGNEYLLRKTDDCNEYYKTWE